MMLAKKTINVGLKVTHKNGNDRVVEVGEDYYHIENDIYENNDFQNDKSRISDLFIDAVAERNGQQYIDEGKRSWFGNLRTSKFGYRRSMHAKYLILFYEVRPMAQEEVSDGGRKKGQRPKSKPLSENTLPVFCVTLPPVPDHSQNEQEK